MNSESQHQSFDLMRMDRQIGRQAKVRRVVRVLLWSGLIVFGLRKRGVLGFLAAAYGVERLSHLVPRARPVWDRLSSGGRARAHFESTNARDRVDEASWESFPASDPPGHG